MNKYFIYIKKIYSRDRHTHGSSKEFFNLLRHSVKMKDLSKNYL